MIVPNWRDSSLVTLYYIFRSDKLVYPNYDAGNPFFQVLFSRYIAPGRAPLYMAHKLIALHCMSKVLLHARTVRKKDCYPGGRGKLWAREKIYIPSSQIFINFQSPREQCHFQNIYDASQIPYPPDLTSASRARRNIYHGAQKFIL